MELAIRTRRLTKRFRHHLASTELNLDVPTGVAFGYLPGEFAAYPDLTGAQYLRYLAQLRGGVEQSAVDRLAKRFEPDVEIGTLSHGNRQKIVIIQAFMHEPDLIATAHGR